MLQYFLLENIILQNQRSNNKKYVAHPDQSTNYRINFSQSNMIMVEMLFLGEPSISLSLYVR